MTSISNNMFNGFSGSGTSIDDFEVLNGAWSIQDGAVSEAQYKFQPLLVHKTARLGSAFTLSVTVESRKDRPAEFEGKDTWDGLVVNVRPSGNGWRFITFRIRQGGPSSVEWQLLDSDSAGSVNIVIANGTPVAADKSKALRLTLSMVEDRFLYRITQAEVLIDSGEITRPASIGTMEDTRFGV